MDFTDAAGLVRWRQHIRFHEKVTFPVSVRDGKTSVDEPVYYYDWRDRPEPEPVADGASSGARPGGCAVPGTASGEHLMRGDEARVVAAFCVYLREQGWTVTTEIAWCDVRAERDGR